MAEGLELVILEDRATLLARAEIERLAELGRKYEERLAREAKAMRDYRARKAQQKAGVGG